MKLSQFFIGLEAEAFGTGVSADSRDPWKVLFDLGEYVLESFLGHNESISITEKESSLAFAMLCGKEDVSVDNGVVFDIKAFALIGSAKCAFGVRAAQSYLKKNAPCFTGWSNNHTLMVHEYRLSPTIRIGKM